MAAAELANLEALVNIIANGAEIFGIAAGGMLLTTSFIPFASGLKGYTSKIAICGVLMIVAGLAVPGIINWLVWAGHDANTRDIAIFAALVVGGILALAMACVGIGAYFLPTIIARREDKKNKMALTICNCFAFLPFVWLVSYIWACIPEKMTPPVAAE